MTRFKRTIKRCVKCRLLEPLCMCSLLPTLPTRTRVLLVMHHIEKHKPTNTGRLASFCLPNSEIVIRGLPESKDVATELHWDSASQPLYVYPHIDATPIEEFANSDRPITLIVPDGTWKQANRIRRRMPELKDVPCVRLPVSDPSSYKLRTTARTNGLSTIEAIARAMGILESAHVEEELMLVFRTMVERSLAVKGPVRPARRRTQSPEA